MVTMGSPILSDSDLENLFLKREQRRPSRVKRFSRAFGAFVVLYCAVFFIVNFSSISSNLGYWYKTEYKNEAFSGEQPQTQLDTNQGQQQVTKAPDLEDNHIKIETISVTAPITWRINNNEKDVQAGLANGVIHISGTASPGENGNVFITGHSSDYPWSKGKYKTVFVLLDKLVVGDTVQVKYQGTNYFYKVTKIKVVNPDDLSVMNPTPEPTLTLMTCTPVGTTLRRLIVSAAQTSPSPTTNKTAENQTKQRSLPKPR